MLECAGIGDNPSEKLQFLGICRHLISGFYDESISFVNIDLLSLGFTYSDFLCLPSISGELAPVETV